MWCKLIAAGALALAVIAPATAQNDHALTLHSLQDSDLPVKHEPLTFYYSPAAEAVADFYAATVAEAVAWYRAELDWRGPLTMAVLDDADYTRYAGQPYPVPYAEIDTGLIVMPDSIAEFPGFAAWGMEDQALNANLTFHEIGHAIARQTGLWTNSFWVNELVANVFLAAYLHANRTSDRGLLDGVPQGFEAAGREKHLVMLDILYSGVGLDNYAWYQFRLAEIADYLVDGSDFGALFEGLRQAFPAGEPSNASVMPTPEEALRRLEKLKPGVTALATDMLGRPAMDVAREQACTGAAGAQAADGFLEVENAREADLAVNNRDNVRFQVRLDLDTELTGTAYDAEVDRLTDLAMATDAYAIVIPPRHRRFFSSPIGTEYAIVGGRCLTVLETPARYLAAR